MFRKILIPVDFSACSRAALRLARQVASAPGSAAEVTLLHVNSAPYVYTTEWGLDTMVTPVYQDLTARFQEVQGEALRGLAAELIPDLRPALRFREGYPPDEIIAEAREGGYDLLVMGSHGRTGVQRALLGSVTERVLRGSPIPVLVTTCGEEKDDGTAAAR